ncbi:RNA polymerase II transcription elongation factor-domain-containing protein [Mariannaea sp. PMI_226]|nr:RNA polymerase II transcription elongation factor-domain-containing protein [Mariannaea sp. PMI_226]
MAGLIDPTKTGKYPVILGESLKGKGAPESVFTAIQYNHKPTLTSASAPSSARLKPSTPGKTSSYDLTYNDNGQKYAFSGPRDTEEKKYVLYFDPKRKAFILDKVDSTFNMNAIRLPGNSDPESLRRQYPHIEPTPTPAPKASKPAPAKAAPLKPPPKPKAKPVLPKKDPVKRKPEKKAPAKPISLSLPVPEPPSSKEQKAKERKEAEKPKRNQFEEDEDEDEDDDGGLLVEYPDGDPRTKAGTGFSPAFPAVRRFDDFMNQRESETDPDSEEAENTKDIKFPSFDSHVDHNDIHSNYSASHHIQRQPEREPEPEPMDEDDDLEDDFAKEMEMAFDDLENSQDPTPDAGDESEISEED